MQKSAEEYSHEVGFASVQTILTIILGQYLDIGADQKEEDYLISL